MQFHLPLFVFDTYNLLGTFLFTVAVQISFFVFAAGFKTDRVTDFAYSITFILLAALFYFFGPPQSTRSLLVLGAITIWGLRLGTYLFVRIHKIGTDARFDGRRENLGRFAAFWSLQAVAIWVIMLPATVLASASSRLAALGPVAVVGLVLFGIGLVVETVADWQKFSFKLKAQNRERWIESGLWRYSRYPNYFGEILLWWGLFLVVAPALSGLEYAAVAGPLFITWLLLKVSGIPLLEESSERKYGNDPAFQEYRSRTNLLLPWAPRKV